MSVSAATTGTASPSSTPVAEGAAPAVTRVPSAAPPAFEATVTAVAARAAEIPSSSSPSSPGAVTQRMIVSWWVSPIPRPALAQPACSSHHGSAPASAAATRAPPTAKQAPPAPVRAR